MIKDGAVSSEQWDEHDERAPQEKPISIVHKKRSRRGVKSAKYRAMENKLEKYRLALWAMSGVVALTLLGSYMYVDSEFLRTLQLEKQAQRLSEEIVNLKQQLELNRMENAQLVEGRIPSLRALTTGEVMHKPAKFVESLLFTKTKSEHGDRYEYMAVLSNDGILPVTPQVDIHLFDATGVQVGSARVTRTETPLGRRKAQLHSEESRSHSGELTFRAKAIPTYFLLETKGL